MTGWRDIASAPRDGTADVTDEFKRGYRAAMLTVAEHTYANELACRLDGLTTQAEVLKATKELCLKFSASEPNWRAVSALLPLSSTNGATNEG